MSKEIDDLKAVLPAVPSGARSAFLTLVQIAMDMAENNPERAVLSLRSALAQAEVWAHDVRQKKQSERMR